MTKKNIKYIMFYFILFIIFIILAILLYKQYNQVKANNKKSKKENFEVKSNFEFNSDIKVKNINLKKEKYQYILSFDVIKNDKLQDNTLYNLYLLDDNDNLLYTFRDVTFSFENEVVPFTYYINYDISSLNKIIIMDRTEKINYNKDISNSLDYIGNTSDNFIISESNVNLPSSGY